MEEALHDVPLFREFAGLNWDTAVPDETTILRFRRLLEEHKLAPRILTLVNELLGARGLLLRAGQAPKLGSDSTAALLHVGSPWVSPKVASEPARERMPNLRQNLSWIEKGLRIQRPLDLPHQCELHR